MNNPTKDTLFQTTVKLIRDCYARMGDRLTKQEKKARKRLVNFCGIIHEEFGQDFEE